MSDYNITRRGFIGSSLVSMGAAVSAARGTVPLAGLSGISAGVLGANEKVRLGVIGCGGISKVNLNLFLKENPEVECPIICDIDDARLAETVKFIEASGAQAPEAVKDFRAVLDRKDIDACMVATPDHWHALPTIMACQAGKDVYCEKPLATTVQEGRAMLEAARKYDRIVQMGTQWRSGEHFAEAVEYIHAGKLGKIRTVELWTFLDWAHAIGNVPDSPCPDGVDYDMWLGPAPEQPFNRMRFHFNFRWFWDYAGGLMTDWGVHLINIAMWAMRYPQVSSVMSAGGNFTKPDTMQETPDTQMAIYTFKDFIMTWDHQMSAPLKNGRDGRAHGIKFYGTEAVLILDGAGWEVIPAEGKEGAALKRTREQDSGRSMHIRNFLDGIKSRKPCVQDFEVSHLVSNMAHLGNMALQTGKTIHWDAENERVIGDEEANANRMISRPYRGPWKLEV
ncbi:MAG: Gfo/Idh/MocA family oxidoreductase [Phycisphaerales bacterium]|nr:Gfo/Idh/MocA family oxidoreductase [Phycisphaerales bacterium]